jgi:AraC-like DNA-binding protein
MAQACIYRPGPPLDDLVDCFWLWDGYPAPAARERALPSGSLDLVINLERDRLQFYADDQPGSLFELPGISLSGAHARYFGIGTSPSTRVMGVHFKPGGALPFLDISAADLAGQHAALATLWGNAAPALRERLLEAPTSRARFECLEAFLIRHAKRPLARPPALRAALRAFENPARGSVAEVNQLTGLSPKRLIALFREEVGLTPKAYWRVRRFQAALRRIDRGGQCGARLAAELGYFDQAHFDREFRALCGLSPTQYRAQEVQRPNHVPLRG